MNLLPAVLLMLLFQTTNATVSGTVVDPAGAVVPSVKVTLENVNTGIVLTGSTNEAGIYQFPSVQPGSYKLSAEINGFRKYVRNNVTVDVAAHLNINIPLEVVGATESVEVTARADAPMFIDTPSVTGVISGRQILELPVPDRDALGLVLTQSGLLGDNFAGTRISALNVTRDGINVMDQFINSGVNSVVFENVEDVAEVSVTTSPVDAELGRGSGQVQIATRSGDNEFHGSLYEFHRNAALNANDWFSNLQGIAKAPLIFNEFGGRIGGPIRKNHTFFLVSYDGQRERSADRVTSVVYTQTARNGIYRFFPFTQNANANGAIPTVDLAGNPVAPNANARLQSVPLFGRDPFRNALDPSGTVQKLLNVMPLPNDFRAGDGLNTAGYTWRRRFTQDFDHYNIKIDHQINERHRVSFNFVREDFESLNGFMPQTFPTSPGGSVTAPGSFYSLGITSTFSPRVVNEFRAGAQRVKVRFNAPWELPGGRNLLPTANGYGYLTVFNDVTDPIPNDNDPQGRISPLYTWGDTLHWYTGRHAFKFGGDVRFVSSNVFDSFTVVPVVQLGVGFGPDVTNVDSSSISGLGVNEAAAQGMLFDLTGSVDSIFQGFNASGGTNPKFIGGVERQRTWRQRELGLFFQDDFKLRPGLTLNGGFRYEFYGVPWDAQGRAAALVGGSTGLFGISGKSWSSLYQPGLQNGTMTQVQLVGKGSPNPNTLLYNNDWNNFAPIVGMSWSLPYFGKDKTILRAGYSVAYERAALVLTDDVSGVEPGLSNQTTFVSGNYVNLGGVRLPLQPSLDPLAVVPFEDRSQTAWAFDNNLRTPYTQNWNFTIQRELPNSFTLDFRYVGSKGTKLLRTVNIDEVNIFENGLLDAFKTTQIGGTAPLLDRLFAGYNLGLGTINGNRVTGSASVRQYTTTRAYLANNEVGAFADFINRAPVGGEFGAIPRDAGFPENWITVNPQFAAAEYVGNFANSTYHSFQLNANKRFSSGWTLLSNYTWSRALGEDDGSTQDLIKSFRTGRNRHFEKHLLGFHRTHILRNSGIWELPIGPGKHFLPGVHGIAGRLIEHWQLGGIFNVFSGAPIGLASGVRSLNQFTLNFNTPTQVGSLSNSTGHVTRTGNGVVYFDGLKQTDDPAIASLTTQQSLNQRSTLKAITDSSGKLIAVNPGAGTLGTMSQTFLQGPGSFRLDVNLIKRVRLPEDKELQIRAEAFNLLNTPQFGDPITNINSTSFGRIVDAVGNRIMLLGLRVNW